MYSLSQFSTPSGLALGSGLYSWMISLVRKCETVLNFKLVVTSISLIFSVYIS